MDEIRDIKVVYIKTSPYVAYNRVVKRDRQGEEIPLEYLAQCSEYHDKWINDILDKDKLILNGESDNSNNLYYQNMENDITTYIMTILQHSLLVE